MKGIKAFIKKYPVLTYYAMVFTIAWGGVLMIIGGPAAIPGTDEQVARLSPLVMLVWLAGPSLASILLTALIDGRAGLHQLLTRLCKWQVGARWYAVALLTAPLLYLAVLLSLSLLSADFLPGLFSTSEKASLLLFGLVWGLIGGGFLEELGWTGFVVPRLRLRHGVFTTGLIVGVLWGAVHFSVIFWMAASTFGSVSLALFVPVRVIDLLVGSLVAYRVLMVWVYDHTESLLVAMLMHASLTASMITLAPLALQGTAFLTYCLVLSAAMWLVVAVVAVASHGQLSHQANRHSQWVGNAWRGV